MSASNHISAQTHEGLDLARLIRLLWDERWAIAIGAIVTAAIAAVWAALATPVYRAEVVIGEVEQDGLGGAAALMDQFGGLAGLAGVDLSSGSKNRDGRALLRSRRLAEEFIARNKLLAEMFPRGGELATMWFGVQRFRSRTLNVREDTRTGLITIAINARDPRQAADWANSYVALANELLRSRALAESSRNIEYLTQQVAKTNVVEMQRVLYRLIENETKTHMLARVRTEYAFTVIDPAAPPELRVSPQRTLMVLGGLILGSALGFGLALVRRALRRRRAGHSGRAAV